MFLLLKRKFKVKRGNGHHIGFCTSIVTVATGGTVDTMSESMGPEVSLSKGRVSVSSPVSCLLLNK